MSVLVIAATEMEIAPFIENYPHADFLITGVGVPSVMYKLVKKIQQGKHNMIIQTGIAGSFSDLFVLGETVLVKQDAFADIGAIEKGDLKTVYELRLSHSDEFPFDDGFLINPHLASIQINKKLANGITVNTINDDQSFINQIQNKFSADIESMEGAALHYVCLQEKIPFLQIRGISNKAGERDKSAWKIREAVESSNLCLMEIYESSQNNFR